MATIDSLQDSVNTLTSSTTALLDEVNVSKATLIDSKDLAEAAASSATTQAANAASSASAASLSASSASSSASAASASAASASAIVTGVATGMPSVRPSLNLDFVNSKTVDPRISFTRSTTATYYDGKTTAKAEENLFTNSSNLASSFWNKHTSVTTGAVAPDGTTTALKVTPNGTDNSYVGAAGANSMTPDSSQPLTFSVWLKADSARTVTIQHRSTVSTQVNVTTEWQQFSITSLVPASDERYQGVNNLNELADTTPFYMWGPQLERRASATAYTPTVSPITNYIPVLQTAAINEPRLDHDPVTGEAKGLLIEEARTNLHDLSEDFGNAGWVKDGLTVTVNQAIAPNGTQTADQLTVTDVSYRNYRQIGKATSPITYTSSCYLKQGTAKAVNLHMDGGSVSNKASVVVDLSLGEITGAAFTTGTFSNASATIEPVGNDWYRVSLTFTSGSEDRIRWHLFGYGAEEGKHFFAWGAQMEAGSFPTSYIPTSGASVTRGDDLAVIPSSIWSQIYNESAGSIAAGGVQLSGNDDTEGLFVIDIKGSSAADTNTAYFVANNGLASWEIRANNATQLEGRLVAFPDTKVGDKYVGSWARNDFIFSCDGNNITDNTGYLPVSNGLSKLVLGRIYNTYSYKFNGHLHSFAYWPVQLPDSQVQVLATN